MAFQAHFKLQLLGRFMVSDMFQDETRLTGSSKYPTSGVYFTGHSWPHDILLAIVGRRKIQET